MGFNAKAFAAAFMTDSARQINERVAEAREYKRELKEKADEGKTKIAQLRQLGNLAKSEIARLRALGFEDKHINAAIASGPKGLFDLSVSAQEEAARRNFTSGQKFDEYEIESLIDFSDNFAYGDVKSEEFYQMNTALTDPSLGSTKDPQRGLMKTIFGIDLDDSVRAKLDKDAFYDGYSVMDINEISKQETYDSVAPGTYFSFTPTRDFDPTSAASAFNRMINTIDSQIQDNRDSGKYLRQAELAARGDPNADVQTLAMQFAAQDKQQMLFNQISITSQGDPSYVNRMRPLLEDAGLSQDQIGELEYGSLDEDALERKVVSDILKNKPSISTDVENKFSVNYGKRRHDIVIGTDKKVKSISVDGQVLREDQIDTIIEKLALAGLIPSVQLAGDYVEPTKVIEPEATQDFETFDSEDTSASAISSRFEKASEKRKEAMSDKVPPRPEGLTMSSIFGGKPLGAEDIEDILAGRMAIPKNLRPNQWDELFGDTHDPETGEKLSEETDDVVEETEKPKIVDLRKYETEEETDKAFDSIPIGGGYIDIDGTQHTKTMERK